MIPRAFFSGSFSTRLLFRDFPRLDQKALSHRRRFLLEQSAAVVLGRTANGWVEWKDKNGATLSEIHRDTDETATEE